MSIWEDEWEDYEMDKADFECWLDSLEGEGTPEEKYNRYQKEQARKFETEDEYYDRVYENEIMNQTEYPEWMIKGRNYIMTVSNN